MVRHAWLEANEFDSIVFEGNKNALLHSRIINKQPNTRAVRIIAGAGNKISGNNFSGGAVNTRTIRDESGQNNDLDLNVYSFATSMRNLYLTQDANNPCPANTVCIEK